MSAATRKKRAPDPGTLCRQWVARAQVGDIPRLLCLLPPSQGEEEIWFGEQILAAARHFARSIEGLDFLDLDAASPDFQPGLLDSFLNTKSLFASRQALVLGRASKALQKWPRLADSLLDAATAEDGPEWMVVQVGSGASKGAKAFASTRKKGIEKLRFRGLYGDPPPWKPEPDASEAAQFVTAEARQRKLRLQNGVAGLLVTLAGSRPGDLVQAVEHFQMLGLTEISEDDVRRVTAHSAEGSAFDFADAVLAGDTAQLLRLLQRLSAHGMRSWDGRRIAARDAFSIILAAMNREHRKTSQVLAAVRHGSTLEKALEAAGVRPSMPVVRRMQTRLQVADEAHLQRVLAAMVEAEENLKMVGWRDSLAALEFLAFRSLRKKKA